MSALRRHLGAIGVENAAAYRAHDFRRGHAKDMQERGATVQEILAAGQWRSPSFLEYLDVASFEMHAVMEAHIEEEHDED